MPDTAAPGSGNATDEEAPEDLAATLTLLAQPFANGDNDCHVIIACDNFVPVCNWATLDIQMLRAPTVPDAPPFDFAPYVHNGEDFQVQPPEEPGPP